MRALLKIILTISLVAQTAGAGDQEDAIRKQAQKVATEEAIKSLTKRMIDKLILDEAIYNAVYNSASVAATNAGAQAANAGAQTPVVPSGFVTIGATVIAVYNIGKSAKDFHKADTDQQRMFAAANAVASAMTVAFPPVGLIMQLAILGQGIIESGYAKRLGEIYGRTLEYQKRTLELRNEHLQSQWQEYAFTFSKAVESAQLSTKYIEFLQTHCQNPQTETRSEQLEACLNASTMAVVEMQTSVMMSRRLLTLPATDFKFFHFLAAQGMTSFEYLQRLKDLDAHVAKMREANHELQKQYSNFLAELYVREAVAQGQKRTENYYSWSCESLAQNVAQQSLIFRIKLPRLKLVHTQKLLAIGGLQIQLEDFLAEDCESKVEIPNGQFNAFETIRNELKILTRMKGEL